MAPEASFSGSGLDAATDHGLRFKCSKCGATVRIKDPGALFTGALIGVFWAGVAYWVFWQGPYWYATHVAEILGDFHIVYFLADLALFVLGLAVVAFCGWLILIFFIGPLSTLLSHPATHENRPYTQAEQDARRRITRAALVNFFVLPLGLWVPLLASVWGLNALGVDLRGGLLKYVIAFGLLGIAGYFGKRLGVNLPMAMAGMIFWLVLAVTVLSLA